MGKFISCNGASHVAQWYRICLPMQETQEMRVQSHLWWTKPEILLICPFPEKCLMTLVVYFCVGYSSNVLLWASQVPLVVKNPPGNAGDARDADSILGLRRSPGVGNGNPLRFSCLDRGAWWATIRGAAGSQTWLSKWAHTQHTPLFILLPFTSCLFLITLCQALL